MTGIFAPAQQPRYAAPLTACDEIAATAGAGGLRVTGITRIRGDGPYLSGHFPEITIFPGVFILEAVVQAVAQSLGDRGGRPLRPYQVRSLRLLNPLYPGDQLTFEAEVTDPASPDGVVVTADCCRSDGVRVATMTVGCGWSP